MAFPNEDRIVDQWYIFWRRVAAGLSAARQEKIFDKIFPSIKKNSCRSREAYLLVGSLERLEMKKKILLGQCLVANIVSGKKDLIDAKFWSLARLSSRVPLYSGPETIIRAKFVESWLQQLIKLNHKQKHYRKSALVFRFSCRIVDNIEFDMSSQIRQQGIELLKDMKLEAKDIEPLVSYQPLDAQDEVQLFGEALPVGLVLH